MSEPDPYDQPGHRLFIEQAARDCRCCPVCSNPPCDGVLQGAPCDAWRCRCDEERELHEEGVYSDDRRRWGDEDDGWIDEWCRVDPPDPSEKS
jgi:hypothetical protein